MAGQGLALGEDLLLLDLRQLIGLAVGGAVVTVRVGHRMTSWGGGGCLSAAGWSHRHGIAAGPGLVRAAAVTPARAS
jgi:hypothetical protein